MSARGHAPQVVPQPDSRRSSISTAHAHPFGTRATASSIGDTTIPASTLVEQAERSPAQFSPNVLLRPIVQDTLFPTICYVAGPSELAYLGQLGGVYEEFGIPMPLIYSRATATIVDSAAVRFLVDTPSIWKISSRRTNRR